LTPFPHVLLQTLGAPEQTQPTSVTQSEHPSDDVLFESSQSSPALIIPFPHNFVQTLTGFAGVGVGGGFELSQS